MKKDKKIEKLEKRVKMLETLVKALSVPNIHSVPEIIKVPVPYYPPYPYPQWQGLNGGDVVLCQSNIATSGALTANTTPYGNSQ